jgi:hypothetical protein
MMRDFTIAEKQVQREIREAGVEVTRHIERQKWLPVRIPLSKAPDAKKAIKLSTKRKHPTNVLKMVTCQIEGNLVEFLRPICPRTEDERRTLIQAVLRSSPQSNRMKRNCA